MALGQEFTAYAVMIEEDRQRLTEAAAQLESNLGGTAIGTGINGHPRYAELACAYLAGISGEPVRPAGDFIEATQDCGAFVQLSGVLKRVAVKLSRSPSSPSSPTACCAPLPIRARPATPWPPAASPAHRQHLHGSVHRSIGLVTALAPHVGYAAGTTLARRALATGRAIKDLAAEAGLLTADPLDTILRPENLTGHSARPSAASVR